MMRLLIAPVAVAIAATLAIAAPAQSQEGAQRLPCSAGVPGASILTPDGNGHTTSNANVSCGLTGPAEPDRARASISCSLINADFTGNLVVTPTGHTLAHCNAP